MSERHYVKVIGFADFERHALSTAFRLSEQRHTRYGLWQAGVHHAPAFVLVDGLHPEARAEHSRTAQGESPRLLWVGADAPAHAWRQFQRPLNWSAIIGALDGLFGADQELDLDFGEIETLASLAQQRRVLLLEPQAEDRMYLRTKLAAAGLTEVDEAQDAAQARSLLAANRYGGFYCWLDLPQDAAWSLLAEMQEAGQAPGHRLVASAAAGWWRRWRLRRRAARLGCPACVCKPLDPRALNQWVAGLQSLGDGQATQPLG